MAISIHAPTRGATFKIIKCIFYAVFQSTLPRGERQQLTNNGKRTISHFNPRSHEGSDAGMPQKCKNLLNISIHAPTRGATSFGDLDIARLNISIHAPTRGATVYA